MNVSVETIAFWFLATTVVLGAVVVLTTREVMRLIVALGVALLALAGLFGLLGLGFLAVSEIFLYVGGVLVVFLFAIMLARRGGEGAPELATRHGVWPALVSLGVFAAIVVPMWSAIPRGVPSPLASDVTSLAAALLGPLLPQFEIAGIVLLAALAAVVAVVGSERR